MSTSSEWQQRPLVTWSGAWHRLHWFNYRLGTYLLLHVVDDPAWLALIFC